jgi:hypothetical protein
MADQSLQAFQLGANLFDRAQTQQRMMEQFQQQTAESLLQRQGMELQNKIRDVALADAIGEQKAQVEEFDTFSKLGREVSDYLNNPKPDSKFPVVPPFKSKTYRLEADKMLNNLEKYSARAELFRARAKADAEADRIAASTLNEAIKFGAITKNPDGSLGINVDLLNQRAFDFKKTEQERAKAQASSLLGNIEIKKADLQRLISQGASRDEVDRAKLELDKSIKEGRLQLDREELDLKKETERSKIDILRQKVLQPLASSKIKLNEVDDRLVKKYAEDIANKQSISSAIGYEISVLEDPGIEDYIKLNSANAIAKVLNSAEGKDAVGVEESKRLLGELDLVNLKRAFQGGSLIGPDLKSFSEKISLKKGELDQRVKESSNLVNDIYTRYGLSLPAGTTRGQTTPVSGRSTYNVPLVQPSSLVQTQIGMTQATNTPAGLTPKAKRVRQGGKEYVWDETVNNWKEIAK